MDSTWKCCGFHMEVLWIPCRNSTLLQHVEKEHIYLRANSPNIAVFPENHLPVEILENAPVHLFMIF